MAKLLQIEGSKLKSLEVSLLPLSRWAGYISVRAEDTAIAGSRSEHGLADYTFVEELARIGRHVQLLNGAALRTSQFCLRDNFHATLKYD